MWGSKRYEITYLWLTLQIQLQVTALEKDLVSWLRRRDLFPVLLTVGFLTHSQDSRFSVDFAPPNDYRLKVSNVGWNDAGLYLCQLAVHPPALIWTRLEIDPPVVHLLDVDGAPVWELHYDVGTTLEMMCRIKRPPLQGPYTVEWEARSEQGQVRVLHRDVERGGVRVDTGMESKSGFLFSRISLASAKVSDAGNYTCRLGGVPQPVLQSYPHLEDTIVVHVLQGEITKAIHGKATRLKILQIPTILTSLLPIFWTTMLPRSIWGSQWSHE